MYRDKSGGEFCKPPDNHVFEDLFCDKCQYYLNPIDESKANQIILDIINNYPKQPKFKWYHKLFIKFKWKIKPIRQLEAELIGNVSAIQAISREDYISQVIALSQYWQNIINSHIASVGTDYGLHNNWVCQSIFGKPAKELTALQLVLLRETLKYIGYRNQYHIKSICKQCWEEHKLEAFLKPRQKHCHRNKEHLVNNKENRLIRWYFGRDKDEKMYIDDMQDTRVISLLEWHTDNFSETVKAKERIDRESRKK